ncbi:MAG: Gfo/Idh/MocA family oxidoreductase [Tannerella sp.]|jgi:predicted dehydrogenase|nr:Gfo/Idh/MocA family oxidoreductase [Tannerella sp.]
MKKEQTDTNDVRLITLDPGHFHAALVQKISYPGVSPDVYVYAPAGADLDEHLKKIDAYNTRAENPAKWNEIVYTGQDFFDRMIAEKKGNVMVTAGNNGKKTEYILKTLQAGINVLADKPMAINAADYEILKQCFDVAKEKGILLYDIMTERFEIATILQKEFSQIAAVYGEQQQGTPTEPGMMTESIHHFFKVVSGKPLIRPAWFFDTEQQGEGIVDVTTHLIDLVQWQLFPEQSIEYVQDVELIDANRWTTSISPAQFGEVTGLQTGYPDFLKKDVVNDTLKVYANGDILFKLRGVYAQVAVKWNYTYPQGGGDTHYAIMRGSKAHLIIEQGKEQNYRPTLYIQCVDKDTKIFEDALKRSLGAVAAKYDGIGISKLADDKWEVTIPAKYHNGHEAHFGQVTEHYLEYLRAGSLPAWEVPNMISKYRLTTQALEFAKNK